MRMMNELKPLFLYSASKKVYVPIDGTNKRKNSAILLLTPSLEISNRLMTLPYITNPNLFTSFYVDRNVSAYVTNVGIDNIEFDEQEEAAISEAMISSSTGSVKFNIDESTSTMDTKYIREVFNGNTSKYFCNLLGILKVPDKINIVVHPTLSSIKNINKNDEVTPYFYFDGETINLISKMVYDPYTMCGTYNHYLLSSLLYALIKSFNKKINSIVALAIAYSECGVLNYMAEERNDIKGSKSLELAVYLSNNVAASGRGFLRDYIRTADPSAFVKLSLSNTMKKIFREDTLSYMERQRLLPSDFGIPEKRMYPIHNEDHVRAAIKMFNNSDPADEKELANSIIKRMKRFGITDVKVSPENRFYKYYKKSGILKESAEGNLGNNYDQICDICNSLTSDELKLITFTDRYENSKFVIKRIIARAVNNDNSIIPVGFLDVYLFPSNPDIAQIVIAVKPEYRSCGVASKMVKELLKSDLNAKYNFKMYYWTAHCDNIASRNTALRNGFIDTGKIDKYGRKIFIYKVSGESITSNPVQFARNENECICDENSIITENSAIFFEADDKTYSKKLRRYLYSERIRNNKGVILIYDKIKSMNPNIRKTYLKLGMYRKLNLFVDLSYYHALFLKNNVYKLDKAVNLYFDFLNRLINNKEITSEYSKTTIFIPVDRDVWPMAPDSDIYDFRKNLNPISIIFRLIRTNPALLKKEWGGKDIIFVGSRGYFKVDFNSFELKNLARFKTNLRKLMSDTEEVVDEFEIDTINNDSNSEEISSVKHSDSSTAIAAKIIDRIEADTKITIDDISFIASNRPSALNSRVDYVGPHLSIGNMSFSGSVSKEDNIAIITIDPDGPDGFHDVAKSSIYSSSNKRINTYCMPKN